MKLLVVASPDGNLDKLNDLLLSFRESHHIMFGIILGDICLYSESTHIPYFLRTKFRDQATQSIEANKNGLQLNRPVYMIYGALDDPFIPDKEIKINGLYRIWQSIISFAAHNDDFSEMKELNIGFFSGYYNQNKFRTSNNRRLKMSRERQSLALCRHDFAKLHGAKMDILFSYESPIGFPKESAALGNDPADLSPTIGSPELSTLIKAAGPKLVMCGHHRTSYADNNEERLLIGLDCMRNEVAVVDLFNRNIELIKGNDYIYDKSETFKF